MLYSRSRKKTPLSVRKNAYRPTNFSSARKKRSYADAVSGFSNVRTQRRRGFFRLHIRKICTFIGVLLLLIGWGSLPVFLPYFKISAVTYVGFESKNAQEVAKERVNSLLNKQSAWWPAANIFLFPTEVLERSLLEDSRLHSASITKKFPHTLHIAVVEKKSSLLHINRLGAVSVLDDAGGVRQSLGNIDFSFISAISSEVEHFSAGTSTTTTSSTADSQTTRRLLLTDKDVKLIPLGVRSLPRIIDIRIPTVAASSQLATSSTMLDPSLTRHIAAWFTALGGAEEFAKSQSNPTITIEGFQNALQLTISTKMPWTIITDTHKSPNDVLEQIRILLKNQKPKEYIDTRFDGRLYWK